MRLCHVLLVAMIGLINLPLRAAEPKVYFGLLHGHTHYSDGSGDPDDAFKMAKKAGLDFMAITEHNHSQAAGSDGIYLTPPLYGKLIETAKGHTANGKFVAIWGQEFSTISAGNHANIFFADQVCDVANGDFKTLYEEWLPAHQEVPFIQFNHPDVRADQRASTKPKERNNDYGIDDYDNDFDQLVAASGKHVALIELIVGPAFSESTDKPHQQGKHEYDYIFYLNEGLRLAPSVGQDNHKKTWGVATHARMGVWAKELTPGGLMDAIRGRHCYASEDENTIVQFTLNNKIMGSSVLPAASSAASIKVTVTDADEADASYRVKLYYDEAIGDDVAEVVEDQTLASGESTIEFHHTPKVGGYYFVKLTQKGDDHSDDIWTAPIWIEGGTDFVAAGRPSGENSDDPEKSVISWSEASNYVGHDVTVTGRVIRSFNYRDDVVFFNFDDDYDNTLTLIMFSSDFEKFGGLDGVAKLQRQLTNKNIKAKGKISLYKNERIQMRLTSPDQIVADPMGSESVDND